MLLIFNTGCCLTLFAICGQLDVIGIDEAQFFEDLYDFCCKAADRDGKTVIVAGLDGDYLRYTSRLLSLFFPCSIIVE